MTFTRCWLLRTSTSSLCNSPDGSGSPSIQAPGTGTATDLPALKALVACEEEKQLLLTANKEMHDELNLLTVQEYGALTHRYLTQSQHVKLGKKAVALGNQQGISLN